MEKNPITPPQEVNVLITDDYKLGSVIGQSLQKIGKELNIAFQIEMITRYNTKVSGDYILNNTPDIIISIFNNQASRQRTDTYTEKKGDIKDIGPRVIGVGQDLLKKEDWNGKRLRGIGANIDHVIGECFHPDRLKGIIIDILNTTNNETLTPPAIV